MLAGLLGACATRAAQPFPLYPRPALAAADAAALSAAAVPGRVLLAVDDKLVYELDRRCLPPRLMGADADSRLHGQQGDGRLHGDAGDGRLHGASGDARLHGQENDARLHGGTGDARLHGQAGDDRLHGQAGDGRLHGQDEDGRIHGASADGRLHGQGGDGRLYGDAGRAPGCRLDERSGVVSFVNLDSPRLRIFVDRREYPVERGSHRY